MAALILPDLSFSESLIAIFCFYLVFFCYCLAVFKLYQIFTSGTFLALSVANPTTRGVLWQ